MPLSFTANLQLKQPANADSGWDGSLNANATALDGLAPLAAFSVVPAAIDSSGVSTSLNVAVAAGTFINQANAYVTYAGTGSFALSASVTTYLWLTNTGTLTGGAAWPAPGTKIVRLAIVTTGVAIITTIVDARVSNVSAG